MPSYGLRIRDSNGTVILSLTDTITRLRYSVEVAADSNGSIVLSDIGGKSTCEFGLALEEGKSPHLVSRSGMTISWTARTGVYAWPSSNTLVLVFVYD